MLWNGAYNGKDPVYVNVKFNATAPEIQLIKFDILESFLKLLIV